MVKLRICKTCGKEKAHNDFPKHKGYKECIRPHCIECRREKELAYHHKHKNDETKSYKYDKAKDKNKKLMSAYNITFEEYKTMIEVQDYKCCICGDILNTDLKKRLAPVDHCHKTGRIRGILCKDCNVGLGSFKDDIDVMNSAIQYIAANGVDSLSKAKELIALG